MSSGFDAVQSAARWIFVGLLGIACLFGLALWYDLSNPPQRELSPSEQIEQELLVREFEGNIKKLMDLGFVHSVDVQAHRVRMSPSLWSQFTLEVKQKTVKSYGGYFKAKDGYGYVEILSDQNDRALGKWDAWNGVHILE